MNMKIMLVLLVVLVSLGCVEASLFDDPSNVEVWRVELLDVTPSTIPGIALEQASDAKIRLFLAFSPASILDGVEEYEDVRIKLSFVEREKGVKGNVVYKELDKDFLESDEEGKWKEWLESNLGEEGEEWTDLLNRVNEIGIATITLDRIGKGREVRTDDVAETAEEACNDEDNYIDLNELLPDQLDIELRADIYFLARRYDDSYVKKEELTGGIGYTAEDVEDIVRNEMDKWVEQHPDYKTEKYDKREEELTEYWTRRLRERKETLTDSVYFDTTIGIDKSNVNLNPEQLREQICGSIEFREMVQGWLSNVKKVEDVAQNVCLVSLSVGAIQMLFAENPCDAYDTISLGCDWIFCPKSKCNGIDPFNSLIGSTLMCFDPTRRFYNKEVASLEVGDGEGIDVDEVEVFCNASDKEGVPLPHFVCVSGIRGNLEIIDLMAEKYQECLINAKYGGVSVGVCDKLRSYYFCDRIIGGVLAITDATGLQGLWNKITDFFVNKIINGILPSSPENVDGYLKKRSQKIAFVGEQLVKDYSHVPFLQLFADKEKYMKHAICNAFVEGSFFDLESIKEGVLTIPYPDNYYVLTEQRVWSRNYKGDPNSYSYDVFYQIFAGTSESSGWNNYYVYLKGIRLPDEEGKGGGGSCSFNVASGYVYAGELAQENIFVVNDECKATEHCIRFRNKENCNPIGQPLSVQDNLLDPFGVSLRFDDDANKNGVADAWEKNYGITNLAADDDGDGFCNAIEYLTKTNPNIAEEKPESYDKSCSEVIKDLKEKAENGENEVEKSQGNAEDLDAEVNNDQELPEGIDEDDVVFKDSNGDGVADYALIEGSDEPYFVDAEGNIVFDMGVLYDCYSECETAFCGCNSYCCNIDYGEEVEKGETCGGERDDVFEETFSYSDDYNKNYQQKIVEYAEKYDVPAKLALALVEQESQFRHCCISATASTHSSCEARYDLEVCPSSPDLILKGDDGISLGIMQINKNTHTDCFTKSLNSERSSDSICNIDECNGETAYNINCNIAAGMNLLKKKFNEYEKGCASSSSYTQYANIKEYCDNCQTTDGFPFYNYCGWDAALKAYNGWGCSTTYTKDYVKNVRDNLENFS